MLPGECEKHDVRWSVAEQERSGCPWCKLEASEKEVVRLGHRLDKICDERDRAHSKVDDLESRLHQLSEDHSHCEDLLHELGERASRAEDRLRTLAIGIVGARMCHVEEDYAEAYHLLYSVARELSDDPYEPWKGVDALADGAIDSLWPDTSAIQDALDQPGVSIRDDGVIVFRDNVSHRAGCSIDPCTCGAAVEKHAPERRGLTEEEVFGIGAHVDTYTSCGCSYPNGMPHNRVYDLPCPKHYVRSPE